MFHSNDTSADQVLEKVNCRALEVLQFQGDEREARYELLQDRDFWSARESGMPTSQAWDLSEKMDQWTRDLVGRIIATGGARGGHA